MTELSDEKVFFAFSQDIPSVLTVDSGETVRIRTKDCFGNQVQTSEDKLDTIDWNAINPATGPVFVRGAVAGGTLKVSVDAIELDDKIAACTGAGEGLCGDQFTDWSTHLSKIEDGHVVWDDKVRIAINPMIGVIGVAPAGDPVNCGTPGSHGGNMDNTKIGRGTTLYFPVACEGALFGCGDMHAVMGDGEISVSGAEVAGYATVTLTALPNLHLSNPVIETATHFGTIASAQTFDEAADIAVHDMVDLAHERTGQPKDELVMLFSLVADIEVCQMVDPEKTARFMVPKYVLEAYGFVW
ncbi:MAG: acetamidase/formamidase family protein [Raoultibacter sp.]